MDEETKKARYSREVEQSLRQFLNHDGPKGASDQYKSNFDRIFSKERRCVAAEQRDVCTYEESRTAPGYVFCLRCGIEKGR